MTAPPGTAQTLIDKLVSGQRSRRPRVRDPE